jgi:ubiquinol-cytochrome c reductase cytochrome c1 subunit
MKEFKILAVVVFFTLITYYGVEPYAHHQMHKKVDTDGKEIVYQATGFTYPDLKKVTAKGDAAAGKGMISACTGCHGIESQKIKAPMDAATSAGAYGVNPPDLSVAGAIFDEQFLMNFIMNPTHASMVEHKFKNGKVYPMPVVAPDPQTAANIVAYLKSIAPKEVSSKEAYATACGRCHAMRYVKWTQLGDEPETKANIVTHQNPEAMKFQVKVAEYQDKLAKYMGKLPPDLSIMIRARSEHFMEHFIENPQSQLPGTAMPRVGLNKEGFEKVIEFLEESGDPSKAKRQAVGPWVLGFFFIFTLLAYMWKRHQWHDLH